MNTALQNNFTVISILVALTVGLSVALVTWLVSRALAEVPADDRTYKDPPPLGFRVAWWPISWLGHFLQPLLRTSRLEARTAKLRKAGLEYRVSAVQFEASRVVAALLCMALCVWLIGSFDKGNSGSGSAYGYALLVAALCGWFYPVIWLNDQLGARKKELLRSLPFFLDIITLCVEAGLNMQGAINQAVLKGPKGAMRDELQRLLRDIRAGKGRAASMRDMAERLNEAPITHFATAVIQAEQMGMNLGPVLRAQADQRRVERFHRAEKLAMEAPVKMLLPLIAFIFPCTFIVLFFPIAMQFMQSGL
jgi:tight adherence protein C